MLLAGLQRKHRVAVFSNAKPVTNIRGAYARACSCLKNRNSNRGVARETSVTDRNQVIRVGVDPRTLVVP